LTSAFFGSTRMRLERRLVEIFEGGVHGQAPNELRDQTINLPPERWPSARDRTRPLFGGLTAPANARGYGLGASHRHHARQLRNPASWQSAT
jgi:hypothetical protein